MAKGPYLIIFQPMDIITVKGAQDFLEKNKVAHDALFALFETSVELKKPLFAAEEVPELAALEGNGLLALTPGNRYQFNFESLIVCEVLREVMEKSLENPIPDEIVAALEYADSFYLKIREPQPRTTWYFELAIYFDRYVLVYLNQVHPADITAFYLALSQEQLDEHIPLRHFDTSYSLAFPFLTDDIPRCFETIKQLYLLPDKKEYAGKAVEAIGKSNPAKAIQFYEYAKANNAIALPGILAWLLMELYPIDPELYFKEAIDLFHLNPAEGVTALAWLAYTSEKQIQTAYDLVSAQDEPSPEYRRQLTNFYPRLIENKNTTEAITKNAFIKISEFLITADDGLQQQMIWRLGLIEGYDAQKYIMAAQVIDLSPRYIRNLFGRFSEPKYLFSLLKETYMLFGAAVDFSWFSESFSDMEHRNPGEFELELLKLLTDDLAIVRLAGLMVLRSKYAGVYELDFLRLPEAGQKRALETMLPHPHSIEDLLPVMIRLRDSPYESVRLFLKQQMKDLIWAYDHHLIDLVKAHLTDDLENDRLLLLDLEAAYTAYEQIKQQKSAIQEFDPAQNELEALEYYYRTEHEQRAEQMQKATGRSFFTQIARNISVIRGSAFKTENIPEVTRMGTVSTSMLVDMRYYQNPDQYQWEYNQEMTGHNYIAEGSTE